jgi:hypothetical protein
LPHFSFLLRKFNEHIVNLALRQPYFTEENPFSHSKPGKQGEVAGREREKPGFNQRRDNVSQEIKKAQ